MEDKSSRRNFLFTGLALPAATLRPQKTQQPKSDTPELRYRVLGKTGLKVTSLGFGCMITSDASVIERAADIGITYFDTARVYQGGNNERMVGAALKSKRKNLVLSSKSGARTTQALLDDLNTSLKELGTDYLDVWYLHGRSSAAQINDDFLEAQRVAKKEGKIRFAGVSTHGGHADVIPGIIAKRPDLDVVLAAYNFTMDIDPLLASAEAAGLGVVAMKVMAGGFRTQRPGQKVYDTLKKDGAMLAALKWVLRNPKVSTTIPSMTDMDQLEENLHAMSSPFSEGDGKVLAEQLDYIRPLYCRMCGQCDGSCPKGLPVADLLRYLSYAEGYGQYRLGREQFLAQPANVTGVRCDLCPTCPVQCPHGVNVAERLSRAQELFA